MGSVIPAGVRTRLLPVAKFSSVLPSLDFPGAAKDNSQQPALSRIKNRRPMICFLEHGTKMGIPGSDIRFLAVNCDKVRPGMRAEQMRQVREEIVRVASQSFRAM
jgi:hypothetical protein